MAGSYIQSDGMNFVAYADRMKFASGGPARSIELPGRLFSRLFDLNALAIAGVTFFIEFLAQEASVKEMR